VFLDSENQAWGCGYNNSGELGLGDTIARKTPVKITTLRNITMIATGYYHTAFLDNQSHIWTTGANFNGHLGLGDTTPRHTPEQVSGLENISQIWCGGASTYAQDHSGKAVVFGCNIYGQLGLANIDPSAPRILTLPRENPEFFHKVVVAGFKHILVLDKQGKVYFVGKIANTKLAQGAVGVCIRNTQTKSARNV
jgi:alpha-tubulin suppressor-like RCC1 family protein